MSCNLLVNPSFETGSLSPWTVSARGAAQIVASNSAYDGKHYLDLTDAVGNNANSITQTIHKLDITANYTVGVHAQFPQDSAAEECTVAVYMGPNVTSSLVAAEELYEGGVWKFVGGSYTPKKPTETMYISVACDIEDPSYTADAYLDAAVFETTGPCPPKKKTKTRKRKGINGH